MTTTTMRPIASIAAGLTLPTARPGHDAQRTPPATRKTERPSLNDLEITHSDLRAAIAQVRAWGAAVNAARRQQNSQEDEPPVRPPSLILTGPNGTGKTHIARAIQWSLVQTALDPDGEPMPHLVSPMCSWFAAADLLARLGNESDGDGYSYSGSPARMVGSAPFVIIDDVAAELSIPFVAYPAQEAERQIRYHLFFDWCTRNNVPVVLTTNLAAAGDGSDLAAHVGPRAWSRLMQMCPRGYVISLWNLPDYRRKAGGR